jgi:hypothetical protein
MSYTHRWRLAPEMPDRTWRRFMSDVRTILEYADIAPLVTAPDRIIYNEAPAPAPVRRSGAARTASRFGGPEPETVQPVYAWGSDGLRPVGAAVPAPVATTATTATIPRERPLITANAVSFQGVPTSGRFEMIRDYADGSCQTDKLPYDLAVTTLLLRYKQLFPQARITSDGTRRRWESAANMCTILFGGPPDPMLFLRAPT